MIVVKLMGGLGNQMFQYATGKALALKNKTSLRLDLSWYENESINADTPREFELRCFNINEREIKNNEYQITTRSSNKLVNTFKKFCNPHKVQLCTFKEKCHNYDPEFCNLREGTYLDGYWQSEKYFKEFRHEILKSFTFKNNPDRKNKEIIEKMSTQNSISIHVRRGDYASNPSTTSFHGLVGPNYYNSAVKIIANRVKDPHFYVFSDDPQWTKDNIKISYPTTYVSHNKIGHEDMRLMTACKHHIIANSSFSWWGAWLSNYNKKIVICPKEWFKDKSVNTSDVAAKGWLKI